MKNTRADEWMQNIFDLMANRRIEITFGGEMGDVYAVLKVESNRIGGDMREIAEVNAVEDWELALKELMILAESKLGTYEQ